MTDYVYDGTIFENDTELDFVCPITGQTLKPGISYEYYEEVNTWVSLKNGGVSYKIISSSPTVERDRTTGFCNPTSITFSAFKLAGGESISYFGRWEVFTSDNSNDFTKINTVPTVDATSVSVPINDTAKSIKAILYSAGGTTSILDQQLSIVVMSGKTGATGGVGTGIPGDSAKRAYLIVANTDPEPSVPPVGLTPWSYTRPTTVPSGSKLWQCDGTQSGETGVITWQDPYLNFFKVDTLEAITANVGSLTSLAPGSTTSKLTINESGSHEFRAYSANGKMVASIGDSDYTATEAIMASMQNRSMNGGSSTQYAYLSAITDPFGSTYAANKYSYGFVCSTAESWVGSYSSGADFNIRIGCIGASNVSNGYADTAYGAFFYQQNPVDGADATNPKIALLAADTSAPLRTGVSSSIHAAGYFKWGSNKVSLCDDIRAMTVTGDVDIDGTLTYTTLSDARLKTDVTPIQDPIGKLMKLSGNTFTIGGREDVGVIAQEVLEVLPEAVTFRADGYLGVSYEKLIPLLLECIKIQQLQISELQNDVKNHII